MSNLVFHLIGVALATAAFLVFGIGIARKNKATGFNPLPAFILLLVAVVFQFVFPTSGFGERMAHLFLDLGLGMMIASIYLFQKQERYKMFYGPGLISALLGASLYGLVFFGQWMFQQETEEDALTLSILVELGPDDKIEEIQPILRKYDATYKKAFPNVDLDEDEDLAQYFLVYVDSFSRDLLMHDLRSDKENVDQLDINHHFTYKLPEAVEVEASRFNFRANDPLLQQQWYARSLDYNGVYDLIRQNKPQKKAKVAIVDTGVDEHHEDLKSTYEKSGTDGDYDLHSHGTHCAGLAGAVTNNGTGVGSLNWEGEFITLTGYPALDDYGRGTDQRVAKAIIDAAESGADVISMSLGGPSLFGPPKAQVDAIKYAHKKGAIVVVAAGNSNDDARRYSPANIPGVITVSAVDENLDKAVFSNTNTKLKRPIAAPGVNIMSSVPSDKGTYLAYNGTSMATPIVAGLVGMMRAYDPDMDAKTAYDLLHNYGKTVKDSDKVGRVIQPKQVLEAVIK
ncbi:MAG: S8 family serine peptidase [Bacteroidia bacterium]|nr:S8 family serine peptidase [Bacteroidia bacterium]